MLRGSFISVLICHSVCVAGFFWDEADENIQYSLHTRQEGNISLHSSDQLAYELNSFNNQSKTYFIVHGWNGDDFEGSLTGDLSKALLRKEDCNVIYVNWRNYAHTGLDYASARNKVSTVGKDIAAFIRKLEKYGASRGRMHIIGHSLGGQVAGAVGVHLQSPKLARITGIDSADPGFLCWFDKSGCLDPTDAEFVDEIHTLVSTSAKGHADFYPAPKDPMKYLQKNPFYKTHFMGADYYIKSIEAGRCAFLSTECQSWDKFNKGECFGNQQNNLGYYAEKPKDGRRHRYFINIDIDEPCN